MFDGIAAFAFAGIRDLAHRIGDHRKARPLRRTAPLSGEPADDERPEFRYSDPKRATLREAAASSGPSHKPVDECV